MSKTKTKVIYKRGGMAQLKAIAKVLQILAATKHQLLAEKENGKDSAPEKSLAMLELFIISKKSGKVLRVINNGRSGSSSADEMPKHEIITPKGRQIITPKNKGIITPKSDRDERRHRFFDLQSLNSEALLNQLEAPNKLMIVSKITLEEHRDGNKSASRTVKYTVATSIKKASRHKVEMESDCRAASKEAKAPKKDKKHKPSKGKKSSKA